MPKENKTMRKNSSNRNESSSAHYERSNIDHVTSPLTNAGFQDYADMFWDTAYGHVDPSLGEARLRNLLGAVPLIGPFVQAEEQNRMLEDLYNRTGKVPAYPTQTTLGGGQSLMKGLHQVKNLIPNGVHDLSEFYSGEKLGPMPIEGKDYITGDKYVNQ